jgi:1,2-phenylacetyl-CoA epoxidase PaaB subunit
MRITAERYDVFARKAPLEPLQHLGGVSATSPELAYVYAVTTFDEQKWVDVAVVARRNIFSKTPITG